MSGVLRAGCWALGAGILQGAGCWVLCQDDAEMMIHSGADRSRIGIIEMLFWAGTRAMNEFIIVKSTVMMIRISLEGAVTIYFFPIMTPIHLWPGQ